MRCIILLMAAAACFGQGTQNVVQTGVVDARGAHWLPPTSTFASPPQMPLAGAVYVFTDASAVGVCTGGGSSLALCRWSGTSWAAVGGAASAIDGGITLAVDGGGKAITSVTRCSAIPFSGTMLGWTIVADQAGSIAFDVWRAPFGPTLPTAADSVVMSGPPVLSNAVTASGSTSTWSNIVSKGDLVCVKVVSASTVTTAELLINVTRRY